MSFNGVFMLVDIEGNRGRLQRTWIEVVRIDLQKLNLFNDLAQDRLEWHNRIHVTDTT